MVLKYKIKQFFQSRKGQQALENDRPPEVAQGAAHLRRAVLQQEVRQNVCK
jgi:hypothetical protein